MTLLKGLIYVESHDISVFLGVKAAQGGGPHYHDLGLFPETLKDQLLSSFGVADIAVMGNDYAAAVITKFKHFLKCALKDLGGSSVLSGYLYLALIAGSAYDP